MVVTVEQTAWAFKTAASLAVKMGVVTIGEATQAAVAAQVFTELT